MAGQSSAAAAGRGEKAAGGLRAGRRPEGYSSEKRTRHRKKWNQAGQDERNNFYLQRHRIIIASLTLEFLTT